MPTTRLLTASDDFDLILLDLMLPETGCMAFLGVIRKRHPHIPVVVLSALGVSNRSQALPVAQGKK
ncbi:MAG: hypothetical protein Q8L93_06900 [Rhodocyclaceae bacterium]|nr:hypothetical protein [Rhodocyclaceae bacterium]